MTYSSMYDPIKLASAVPGAGKTYAACQHIAEDRHERNQLYVAPSKVLIRQTSDQLNALGVPHTVITEDTIEFGTVAAAVIRHLKDSPEFGRVLLITWQTYRNLQHFHQRDNWNITIDEVPQVDTLFDAPLPFSHHYITGLAQISDPVNEQLALMEAIDPTALNRWLKQPEDAVRKTFRNLMYDIRNPNIDVFVDLRSWNRVVENGRVNKKGGDKNRLRLLRMLRPELFEGATLMGAGVEDSMLYTWLTRYHGVEVQEATHITKNLRFDRYNFDPDRITVSYLMAERPMSKYQRDNSLLQDAFEQGVQSQFPEEPFLLFTNNDYRGELSDVPNAIRMPVKSHGLNSFQDVDNVVFFTAMNRTNQHISVLKSLGFTSEEIRRGTGHETLFQGVMRCSLRDPGSDRPVHVVVADKFEATHLVQAFGQCKVGRLGSEHKLVKIDYRPKSGEKSLVNQQLPCTASNLTALRFKPTGGIRNDSHLGDKSHPQSTEADYCAQCERQEADHIRASGNLWVTVHGHKTDKEIEHFHPIDFSGPEFVTFMKEQANATFDSKEDQHMIVPALLVPRDTEGHRRLANHFSSSFVVLEFDDGLFSPDDAVDCFDTSAGRGQKRSFLLHSSFNRNPETPNKFKMWFPLSEPIFDADAYRAIWDSLRQRVVDYVQDKIGDDAFEERLSELEDQHTKKKPFELVNMLTGLDGTSRSPVQTQYLPCTNRQHLGMALFKAVKMRKRDIQRHSIKPKGYVRTAQKPAERSKVVDVGKPQRKPTNAEAQIQKAKETFNAVTPGNGERHSAFWGSAIWIAKNCIGRVDTEEHLLDMAGSDPKNRRRVPGAMASLNKNAVHLKIWEYQDRQEAA